MKIRIPVLVGDDGTVNGSLYGNPNGSEVDTNVLYDCVDSDRTCLVWVEAEIDVDALFKPSEVTGKVTEIGEVE